MSVFVDQKKCLGCGKCIDICPGDLLLREEKTGKVIMRCPEDCWDCMACVKQCPQHALQTKLPYQLANYKATLQPFIYPDKIIWQLTSLDGKKEEFILKRLDF